MNKIYLGKIYFWNGELKFETEEIECEEKTKTYKLADNIAYVRLLNKDEIDKTIPCVCATYRMFTFDKNKLENEFLEDIKNLLKTKKQDAEKLVEKYVSNIAQVDELISNKTK